MQDFYSKITFKAAKKLNFVKKQIYEVLIERCVGKPFIFQNYVIKNVWKQALKGIGV